MVSLTEVLLSLGDGLNETAFLDRLGSSRFLVDLPALLWPPIWKVDPMRFLGRLAKRRGVLAHWPGTAHNRRLTYSSPERPDYFDAPLVGVILLRCQTTRFPDEPPYLIERVPA